MKYMVTDTRTNLDCFSEEFKKEMIAVARQYVNAIIHGGKFIRDGREAVAEGLMFTEGKMPLVVITDELERFEAFAIAGETDDRSQLTLESEPSFDADGRRRLERTAKAVLSVHFYSER